MEMICDKCVYNVKSSQQFNYCSEEHWEGEILPEFLDENCPDFLQKTESGDIDKLRRALEEIKTIATESLVKL